MKTLKESVLNQAVATADREKYDYLKNFVQSHDRLPLLEIELGPGFNLARVTKSLIDQRTKGKKTDFEEDSLLSLGRKFPFNLAIRILPGHDTNSADVQSLLGQIREFPENRRVILLMEGGRTPLQLPFDWQD